MTKREVLRRVDGSFAVCETQPFDHGQGTAPAPPPGADWEASTIRREWFRVVAVLAYRGSELAAAEAHARDRGLL